MKIHIKLTAILFLAMLLAMPMTAWAGDEPPVGIFMLVTDPDPKGANVRATPGGEVIRTLAYPAKGNDEQIEIRQVLVIGQQGKWFKVMLMDDSIGWMHGSVLSAQSTGTEDGDPWMCRQLGDDENGYRIKGGLTLELLEMRVVDGQPWAKVRFIDNGKTHEGWLPQQCLFSNPYAYFSYDDDSNNQ